MVTAGLAVLVFLLIEYARLPNGLVWALLTTGLVLLAVAVCYEGPGARWPGGDAAGVAVRGATFTAANVITLAVYGALGARCFC
jgi:hypothetical protein